MRILILIFFSAIILTSCRNDISNDPQAIVDKSIELSGGKKFNNLQLSFDFRDKHYRANRNNGVFKLERLFKDSINEIRDVLSNDKFERFINEEVANIPDSMAFKYSNSVNSVHYFAMLPFGLNDPAVKKRLLGESIIKNKYYYKIEVTFQKDGGGKDFEDVFIYWFNKENFKLEYLAYSYFTDGGGMRFRESYNERFVNGIRFLDYNNFKPKSKDVALIELDSLFESDQLILLSKIELKNIKVN